MPQAPVGVLRRLAPSVVVLALVAGCYLAARLPVASADEQSRLASRFRFSEAPIALPAGRPERHVRAVNPAYENIRSWISSVGAAIAVNDLDNEAVADDLCIVDTRSDAVIITPAPNSAPDYEPFVLDAAPLPMDATMAPMGCVPGDFNGDGLMDLLVYYWGRTPIVFLHLDVVAPLGNDTFAARELVEAPVLADDASYRGQQWNTNAVAVADFDGDGHADIAVFNYFPDSPVLDPTAPAGAIQMNHSLSRATNGGGAHVLHWVAGAGGANPSVTFVEQAAIDPRYASGWTLAAASADIDGDLLPELYLANDFGQDRFFHNVSIPGEIRFRLLEGRRGALTPKSMVVGHDSFKGMGVDFSDLRGTGQFDMFVSNITTAWGLEESNFVWTNTAGSPAGARAKMAAGIAPFTNSAAETNLAWVGWGWDAKTADLNNDGTLEIIQTCGFVAGTVNRWSWLQEMAATNDLLLEEPAMWPYMRPGDDVAGDQPLAFWVREQNGRYANLTEELGMNAPIPTRGVAVADTDGDGGQDFAVARQWGPPAFYRNGNAGRSDFLGLRLYRPATGEATASPVIGTPAYGAVVRIITASGRTQVAQLDGGGGHAGKRSFDVFFGLGAEGDRPVSVEVSWRDLTGAARWQTLELASGWHHLMLTTEAKEIGQS